MNLDRIEKILGYKFNNRRLLEEALTHRSLRIPGEENGFNYERLEFLGDAVLEMITREFLLDRYPSETEGELTRRKISLVCAGNLADRGKALGIEEFIRLGDGTGTTGCPLSIVADVVEALFGAVYRDSGLEAVQKVVVEKILSSINDAEGCIADPKSRLQEWFQARGQVIPSYETVSESGPEHEPVFVCRVSIGNRALGEGSGRSRKRAQQSAAAVALAKLKGEEKDGLSAF